MKRRAFLQLLGLAPAIPYFRIPAPDEDVAAMAWGDLTEDGFRYYMRLKRELETRVWKSMMRYMEDQLWATPSAEDMET